MKEFRNEPTYMEETCLHRMLECFKWYNSKIVKFSLCCNQWNMNDVKNESRTWGQKKQSKIESHSIIMITLPGHLSLPPVLVGSCYSMFSFMFCRSLFVLFLLTIVLSVLLRFMDSDCLFGIYKLSFHKV